MAGKKGSSGGARSGAGRKPLPTEVKRLKGTLRKGRTNPHEPKPVGVLCDPPEGMSPEAAENWRYLVDQTQPGILFPNNAPILERYAEYMTQERKLMREISKLGMFTVDRFGISVRSAHFDAQMILSREMRAIEAELGFTPASRSRVQAPELTVIEEKEDPWKNF